MGRRSDHSREELTNLILDAAWNIAESDGLSGLTARNIADKIGYAPGTIYNLFDDLDELILQVRGRTLDLLYDELASLPQNGEPARDLLALGRGYIEFTRSHPNLWNVTLDHHVPRDTMPNWYHDKALRLFDLLESALAPLFENDDAREAALAAQVIWSSLHGIYQLQSAGKLIEPESLDDMTQLLIECFVDGLRYKKKAP
jgi:AcrR family transcriptional regulator